MKTKAKTKRVKVSVLSNHIKRGVQRRSNRCAVALAMRHAGFESANAGAYELWWWSNGDVFYTDTPAAVRRFIGRFDYDKKSVKPSTFTIRVQA